MKEGTMTGKLGMNPEEVKQLATQMDQTADTIDPMTFPLLEAEATRGSRTKRSAAGRPASRSMPRT